MDFYHIITIIFILSLFYFIVGSFIAHFLDRIFFNLSYKWKKNTDPKITKIIKIICLAFLQTFFIILTVHYIRKLFRLFYSSILKKHFGNFDLSEVDGIILLGSLYVIFSTHYKNNLDELLKLLYNE